MDKKNFLAFINYDDKNLLSNIYDKIILAEKINKPVFTNEFLPPNVWKVIANLKNEFNIGIQTYGIFEEAERRMISFSSEDISKYLYPVKFIKISNKSRFESLGHRDYLGAIMGLGIKREKFGDLVLYKDSCYGALCEDILDYVLLNLNQVGKCPCTVEVIEELETENIKTDSENFVLTSTSLRLDSIVSSVCNLSRSKAVDILQNGKVLLDYVEVKEKDTLVNINEVLTIRGYGKFKITEEIGSTQRGRLRLLVKKYL